MPFTRLSFCSREFYLFFHSTFSNGFAKTGIYQLEGSNIHRTLPLWLLRELLQSNIFHYFCLLHGIFTTGWFEYSPDITSLASSKSSSVAIRIKWYRVASFSPFLLPWLWRLWYDGTAHPPRRQISQQMASNSSTGTFVELIWRIHSQHRGFIRIFYFYLYFLINFFFNFSWYNTNLYFSRFECHWSLLFAEVLCG